MRNLIFRDGTNPSIGEYIKGHMTYAEIKEGNVVYMRRWYLLVFPKLFSIRVHHIMQPDLDRWPHDHPWSFISIIIRGGYIEEWCRRDEFNLFGDKWGTRRCSRRRFLNLKRKTDLHKITEFIRPGGAWTLIITGPEGREWGFMTNEGWVSRVAFGFGASAPRYQFRSEPD